MHGHTPCRRDLGLSKNISRTLLDFRAAAKPGFWARSEALGRDKADEPRCAYIAADSWPPGAPPFCGAPVLLGSPYCAEHTRLCTADPASEEGARIALTQDL